MNCVIWQQRRGRSVPCIDRQWQYCEACQVPEYHGYVRTKGRWERTAIPSEEMKSIRAGIENQILGLREKLDEMEAIAK